MNRNAPPEALEILLASWAPNTISQYGVSLRHWFKFCRETLRVDFQSPTTNGVLKFLVIRYDKGDSYSTLCTHRSAISLLSGGSVGEDPLISRFLKGIFRSNGPTRKYDKVWDVSVVLKYLREIDINSLENVTKKLAMLLALSTA